MINIISKDQTDKQSKLYYSCATAKVNRANFHLIILIFYGLLGSKSFATYFKLYHTEFTSILETNAKDILYFNLSVCQSVALWGKSDFPGCNLRKTANFLLKLTLNKDNPAFMVTFMYYKPTDRQT